MIGNIAKKGLTLSLLLPSALIENPDTIKNTTETERTADTSVVKNETGWERLKIMFEADEFGNLSKEVVTIMHVGAMSSFVGAIYGGVNASKVAYINFIKNNQATVFNDHLEAKKRLQDKVTLSFGRGAFRWAWRLSLFCTTFVGLSTTISIYRGKNGILEHVGAGLLTGSLYKFNMGPRGWIVGGGLGATLGLICGCTTLGLLKLAGVSMDEVRYWQYHWKHERMNTFNKGIEKYLEQEEEEVVRQHNKKVGKTFSLDNIK